MQERVAYLHFIGLTQVQVAACIARFPQLFSLNVEANLAPKWRYLVDYIRSPADGVATLCAYPAYFSLSLINRQATLVLWFAPSLEQCALMMCSVCCACAGLCQDTVISFMCTRKAGTAAKLFR